MYSCRLTSINFSAANEQIPLPEVMNLKKFSVVFIVTISSITPLPSQGSDYCSLAGLKNIFIYIRRLSLYWTFLSKGITHIFSWNIQEEKQYFRNNLADSTS